MTAAASMETANYRYHRRMAWQVLRSRYAAAVADELDGGASDVDARKAAARPLRGDTRALMSELLTHAPVPAVLAFLKAAQEWGDSGERLLEQGDAALALALVDAVEPRGPWRSPEAIGREAAEDDAQWAAWVKTWLVMFRATGPEAAAAVSAPATPTSPPEPPSTPERRKWTPLFYSAAAVIGTTAVVALLTRK